MDDQLENALIKFVEDMKLGETASTLEDGAGIQKVLTTSRNSVNRMECSNKWNASVWGHQPGANTDGEKYYF